MRNSDRGFNKETIKLSQIGTGSYFIKYCMGLIGEENEKEGS